MQPLAAILSRPREGRSVRHFAFRLLCQSRSEESKFAHTFASLLTDGDESIRLDAACWFIDKSPSGSKEGQEARAILSGLLQARDVAVRVQAAEAHLGRTDFSPDSPAAASLFALARDERNSIRNRTAAVDVLWTYDRSDLPTMLTILCEALKSGSRGDRKDAIKVLKKVGRRAEPAIPDLFALINSESDHSLVKEARDDMAALLYGGVATSLRTEAVECLCSIGGEASVPYIIRIFESHASLNLRVHSSCLNALSRCGGDQAVTALLNILNKQHPSDVGRWSVISALGELGGPRAIEALRRLLRTGDSSDRSCVVSALENAPLRAAAITDELAQALSDHNPLTVIPAIRILGAIGPGASAALPSLQPLLDSQHPLIKVEALGAVGLIDSNQIPTVAKILRSQLADASQPYKIEAATALGRLGPDFVPEAFQVLDRERGGRGYLNVLDRLADDAPERVAASLADVVLRSNSDPSDKRSALRRIGRLGPKARGVASILISYITHPPRELLTETIEVLGLIGPDADAALPTLQPLLCHREADVREAAAKAIHSIRASLR